MLTNQVVITHTLDYEYSCNLGTGIALLHSPAVSNLLFAIVVEFRLFVKFPDLVWSRYHDDIVFISHDRGTCRAVNREVRTLCGNIFKVVTTGIHSHSTPFAKHLDLVVHLSAPCIKVNPSLEKKPTPLHPSSAHAPSIHNAWPGGLVHRVWVLSEPEERQANFVKLVKQYANVGTSCHTMNKFVIAYKSKLGLCQSAKQLPEQVEVKVPIVLRYSGIFALAVKRALSTVPIPPCYGIKVVPAWKNSAATINSILSQANRKACRDIGRDGGSVAAALNSTHANHKRNSSVYKPSLFNLSKYI